MSELINESSEQLPTAAWSRRSRGAGRTENLSSFFDGLVATLPSFGLDYRGTGPKGARNYLTLGLGVTNVSGSLTYNAKLRPMVQLMHFSNRGPLSQRMVGEIRKRQGEIIQLLGEHWKIRETSSRLVFYVENSTLGPVVKESHWPAQWRWMVGTLVEARNSLDSLYEDILTVAKDGES